MEKLKNIDRRLITILLIVFVQMLGASMALPILPLYAQRQFAMDDRVIPLLISVFFAAQFIAGPTIGRMSDEYGRVPILIISQVGTVIAFALLASAESVSMLFFARILDGITGGNIIVAQAYVTDITPKKRRTEALGYIFAAFGVGFTFGPAIGGVMSSSYGPRAPFWLAAGAALLVVLLTWRTLDESVSAEQRAANRSRGRQSLSFSQIWTNIPLLYVLGIALVTQFAFGLLQSTFALWGQAVIFKGYGPEAVDLGIGLLLSIVGISQLFTQTFVIRRLVGRFTEETMVIMGSFFRLLGFFIFAISRNPWPVPFGSFFFAIGAGITLPPLQSIATKTVDETARGGVLGYYQAATSLAVIISTATAGLLFSIFPTLQLWVSLVLIGVAMVPAFFLRRWAQSQPVESEETPEGT